MEDVEIAVPIASKPLRNSALNQDSNPQNAIKRGQIQFVVVPLNILFSFWYRPQAQSHAVLSECHADYPVQQPSRLAWGLRTFMFTIAIHANALVIGHS